MDLKPMKIPAFIAFAVLSATMKASAAEPAGHANAPAPKQQPDLRGTKKAPLVGTVAPSLLRLRLGASQLNAVQRLVIGKSSTIRIWEGMF
jgi:hypothetical protein